MRVSTTQFYSLNSLSVSRQQTKVNEQIAHLSSGKRIITAKDDAVANPTLAGLNEELDSLTRYERNLNQATNRNEQIEFQMSGAEDLLQKAHSLLIQANNGSYSDADKKSLSQQLSAIQSQLLDIANSTDEAGNYQYAGYQVDTKPFILQADGSVSYLGDNGQRDLQVARNVVLPVSLSGQRVFMDVPNSIGDFSSSYTTNAGGLEVKSANIVDRGVYDNAAIPPDYTFDFIDTTVDGQADTIIVTDGAGGTPLGPIPYTAGQTLAFNGMEVKIDGNPLPGDQMVLTPDDKVGIFETMKAAIDWVDVGASPADPTQHQVDYAHILKQMNDGLNHISTQRSEAGVRLQTSQQQMNIQADYSIALQTSKSRLEDVDFAAATTEFEQSKLALQVAQQTFIQVQSLSLFNYI